MTDNEEKVEKTHIKFHLFSNPDFYDANAARSVRSDRSERGRKTYLDLIWL